MCASWFSEGASRDVRHDPYPGTFAGWARRLLALAALLIGVPVFAQSAVIGAGSPATLNQGNLRQATVSVTLTAGATYAAEADTSHFTLTTAVPGLTVHSVAFNGGRTVATLRLHYDGSDFDAAATIAVTVTAAGTSHNAALTTGTRAISPARWVNVSKKTVALAEGGSAGSYTVVLESTPTGNVTVTVTSDNAAVTVGGAASTTLAFTTTNWATAQTVTVTAVDDNADAVDEVALVTNVATGGGYASSAVANRTVRVTVADDERTGTDYDADDDQLIEIDSLAKLNAMRWDVDGNGVAAAGNTADYAAAFPGAATGMGCPDGGDGDQLSDGCTGYELTANLDFDTNGDGTVDASDAYPNWTPISALGRTFHGNNHTISNLTTSGGSRERGLFARLGASARVSNLALVNFAVSRSTATGSAYSGALVGDSLGTIVAVHVRGGMISVSASGATSDAQGGGLVGRQTGGSITACYSTAAVSASGNVSFGGGLAGLANNAAISVSYAAGAVSGRADLTARFGGLLGAADGTTVVTNSYAAGSVTGTVSGGGSLLARGLVARRLGGASTAAASYWDSEATGQSSSALGAAQTTSALRTPTGYGTGGTDIYAYWDDYDTDGDGRIDAADDAWDFGTSSQYPSLKFGFPPLEEPDEPEAANRVPEVANRAPEVASALTAATLAVGERQRVNLAAAFRDPDGDALAYSAASSNPAVASASVEDAALVLQGVADGVATVTVTATDPEGLSISRTLLATVGTVLSVVGGDAPATGGPFVPASALSVPEGGTLRLDVRLSMPRETPTAFSWRVLTDADPATADADAGEHGDASGTATIAAGATSTEIAIAIADDADVEPAREWFVVELTSDAVALARPRLSAAVLEGVCDRSAAVASELAGRRDCTAPTVAELAARRTLGLDGRGIAALGADDLAGLSGLRWLSLRRNALETLPAGLLRSTPNLRWLLLGGNRLAALREDELAGVAKLRDLDLSDNALEELPGGLLAGLGELRRLRLDGNALAELPAGLFAGAESLRSAFLADNPGAPFALRLELRRTDAAAGEPGPGTIRAELATGAPFAVEVGLVADNAELAAADGSAFEDGAASLAAGDTFGGSVLATAAGSGAARLSATVGGMPATICDGAPCWTGLELSAGPPLLLFRAPPLAQAPPTPAPLFGDDLRLPLQSLIGAGDSPALRWQASSSDPSVATASVRNGELVVAPAPGAEGMAEIEVEAVDEHGLSATLRFMVRVEFHSPSRFSAGWRTVLGVLPPAAEE